MQEAFIKQNFRAESLETIGLINAILAEYQADGYDLTVRQLYYQLVARGIIENSQRSYKRTADLVNNARLAGLVDWDMIADRGRETITPPAWESPAHIVGEAARQFSIDKWQDQQNHVEVMVEKQALEGVLIPVCRALGIRFTANKGYSSSSTLYETGKRLAGFVDAGKNVTVLYLGDHDPSGIDMTRDITKRLGMFSGRPVTVNRLALNMDQVETLNPPENPAKETDSRYSGYIEIYGYSSWELDAIEPRQLAGIVTGAVESLKNQALWQAAIAREKDMQKELQDFADNYKDNRQP